MTVGDYGDLLATELSFEKPNMPIGWKEWIDGMKAALQDSMWAVRDAPLAPGRFPVVVYAPSFSAMYEKIASAGVLILLKRSSPSITAWLAKWFPRPSPIAPVWMCCKFQSRWLVT